MTDPKQKLPELIILERLNRLPVGSLLQTSPIEQEKVLEWATFYKADQVYYWPKTKSAFIVKELAHMAPPPSFHRPQGA